MITFRCFVYFLAIVCLNAATTTAQSILNHRTIGQEELANVQVYTIHYHESSQVLYVGTNEGVFGYFENKFKKIPQPTASKGKSFFNLQSDENDFLYVCNLNGQIFEVNEDSLRIYFALPESLNNGRFTYQFDHENNILIDAEKTFKLERVNGKIKQQVEIEKDHNTQIIERHLGEYIYQRGNDLGANIYRKKNKSEQLLFQEITPTRSFYRSINNCKNLNIGHFNYRNFETCDGCLTHKLRLFNSDLTEIIHELPTPNESYRVVKLNDSLLVKLDVAKGASFVSIADNKIKLSEKIFENTFLSSAHFTDNGTLILGTFNGGLIICPEINVRGRNQKELLTSIISNDDDLAFISTRTGKIIKHFSFNERAQVIYQSKINLDKLYIDKNIENNLKEDDYIVFAQDIYKSVANIIDYQHFDEMGSFLLTPHNLFILSDKSKFQNIKLKDRINDSINKYIVNLKSNARFQCFDIEENLKVIYYSNYYGTFTYGLNDQLSDTLKINDKPFLSNDLLIQGDIIYCGTNKHGLLAYENDSLKWKLNEENGLKSNQIKKIIVKENLIYIQTNEGIQAFDLINNEILAFEIDPGLQDESVIDFDVSNSFLWVMKKDEYFRVPLFSVYDQKKLSNIIMDSIIVNGEQVEINDPGEFNFDQNAFSFYFDYRDINSKFNTELKYILEGFYDEWQTIDAYHSRVEFQSLPIGKYVFKIKAANSKQESKIYKYDFEILPPFYQRWWFYFLLILITATVIGGYAWIRLRNIREINKRQIELEITEKKAISAQLKAIRAQMNPHFIFNSINSIQDLVLQKETLKSYDYLVSFSRLVRMTLDHSEREFVQMQEELDFLDLYLELEELRFKKSDFSFQINNTISNQNIQIPSLIIQPFVENALKHGLLHKKGKKSLTVTFAISNLNSLVCTIVDNGIGRKKAKEIKERRRSNHQSFSTKAIKQRLEILNEQFDQKAFYEYAQIEKGTKVIITLPVITPKDSS